MIAKEDYEHSKMLNTFNRIERGHHLSVGHSNYKRNIGPNLSNNPRKIIQRGKWFKTAPSTKNIASEMLQGKRRNK